MRLAWRRTLLGSLALALTASCANQGLITPGGLGCKWESTGTITGPGTFVTERAPADKPCKAVTVNATPPGDEAYSFVYKLKHRAVIGIPYGEEPVTVYVMGDKTECMKQAAPLKLSTDRRDLCPGPVWVRTIGR